MVKKWRRFKLGKWTLAIYELRTRHTGKGYKLGCGHDIVEICHSLRENGVEVWKRTVGWRVDL